jgi:hypothetical protein
METGKGAMWPFFFLVGGPQVKREKKRNKIRA